MFILALLPQKSPPWCFSDCLFINVPVWCFYSEGKTKQKQTVFPLTFFHSYSHIRVYLIYTSQNTDGWRAAASCSIFEMSIFVCEPSFLVLESNTVLICESCVSKRVIFWISTLLLSAVFILINVSTSHSNTRTASAISD